MMYNNKLTTNENSWLEVMLQSDFQDKDKLIEQIENSSIKREYADYFISIRFLVNVNVPVFYTNNRVIIEMRAVSNKKPIQFLLHNSPHGHVEELLNGKWIKSGPIYPNDVPHN